MTNLMRNFDDVWTAVLTSRVEVTVNVLGFRL